MATYRSIIIITNQPTNQLILCCTSLATDLIQKEKLQVASLHLLRTCISFIPLAVPSGLSTTDLFTKLSRYVIHVDPDLREIGSKTLARLLERFDVYRPQIIHCLAEVCCTAGNVSCSFG
jgi:hypothetical protein